ALGLALLFFCGNVYYAYYMLYVVAIYTVISVFKLARNPIRLKIDGGKIKILAAIGTLALGLIAIQLLPMWEYRDQYYKAVNTDLSDSRNMQETFLDFVTPEPFRPGGFSDSLRPEEFYAYVGWWPLIGMLYLPMAWGEKKKRAIALFLALIVFTFVWIDVKDMPWRSLFQTVPFLVQFRYPSRMVAVGAMALLAAGGLGLDGLLKRLQNTGGEKPVNYWRHEKNIWAFLIIVLFMIWSARDLAITSRPLLKTISYDQNHQQETMEWLQKFDPGIYYINVLLSQHWHQAVIGNEMRYQDMWDSITLIPNYDNQISERRIEAIPKYLIASEDITPPADALLIKTFDTINIYKTTNSLPFAFTLDISTLTTPIDSSLTNDEVTPAASFTENINEIEGVVESNSKKALVVLSSFSSGWQLTVDGRPAKIYNAYGYMAAEVNPGVHRYRFTYQPVWFFVGLITSLATLLVILWILVAGAVKERIVVGKK
ncbi:MAG: YfhO family protein, partial [Anaerolineales bacterium]